MKQDNSTIRDKADKWWETKRDVEIVNLIQKYSHVDKFSMREMVEHIYLSEHPEQAVKEENTVLATWYLIPTSFKPIGELRDVIIAEMDIDVTNKIEKENTSLKARIVVLEDALRKMIAAFYDEGMESDQWLIMDEAKEALNIK